MVLHKNTTGIHAPYSYVFEDATERAADGSYASGDVGKFAFQTDNNTVWVLSAVTSPGASATPTWTQNAFGPGGSVGSLLIPATSGAPSDTPSVSGGHPIRYDPATDRLFVFDGVDWFFTALTKVIQGVGEIEGLVGWWVVDDLTTFGAGDSVPSLSGRVGPTWDNTGYSSPTMMTNEINGKRALNFASGQCLQLPSNVFASATAGELFFVLKGAGESMGNNFPRWGNSGQAQHYPYSGGQVYIDALRNTRVDFSPSPVTLTNWHVIRVQSNSNFRISLNGTQVFNAASGAMSPRTTPLLSGADLNNSARIAAVIAFNTSAKSGGVLTSEEYSVVRDWINSTYAISMS